ncbi:MAG: SusD/RagB family nutrient-binding outer membrane lipoprotein [Saprospiraceae bacterium]|nr:SusD/RagB family nutrient-binding outer membrane lipoprotein [Saprospiraceae bacterium]
MKNLLKITAVFCLTFFGSCGLTDLDGNLEDPNNVGVTNLDPNLLMNKIQLDFSQFYTEVNDPAMQLARMKALIGGDTYEKAFQPQDFDDIWDNAYQEVLIQIETLLLKTDNTNFTVHSGVARVLKAYVLLTLVDMFGDVPYSEALKGATGNFNPKADSGKAVYDAAIVILDDAIALLGKTAPAPAPLSRDIYYAGSAAKWIALANTLKLKAYMNTRLVDATTAKAKVADLLTKDLIDTDAEEFTYKYAAVNVPARSRHPLYRADYQPNAGAAADYISNHFMFITYNQKGVQDPRWRYYFFRQTGSLARALQDDPKSVPCIISPRPSHFVGQTWCSFEPGFFGREHGNSDGIPPDQKARTCYGVYPAGGRIDVNVGDNAYFVQTQLGQGANGAGISPIWMASFTDFLKAEAAITLGTAGDAKALLLSGVKKSITRVRAFAVSKNQTLPTGVEPSEDAYTTKVTELYDAAASNDAKISVYGREYHIALWGNGIEAYNMYRRLGGKPDMQPMRNAAPGNFIRSFIYPSDYVSLNSAAKQKTPSAVNKTFWDNNADAPFNK